MSKAPGLPVAPPLLAPQVPYASDGTNPMSMHASFSHPPVHVAPKPLVLPLPKRDVLAPLSLEREVRGTKHASSNAVLFHVKSGAGVLYSLLNPSSPAYEPPDVTWLKLLEAIALLPSGKPQGMVEIIGEVYRIMPMGEFRNRFQSDFRHELYVKSKMTPREGLVLKDKVNRFIRAYMADPIHGYVFSKTHIHHDYHADDVVQTPVGNGRVRAYRAQDDYYIVVFPWGHGYIHSASLSSASATSVNDSADTTPHSLKRSLAAAAGIPHSSSKSMKTATTVLDDIMHRPPDSIVPKAYLVALAQQLNQV
ncbi:hypothetical protein H257_02718 [Aphanomyces astaci]|uniref:Uncharacterized protein n=1 Tax=Aphanomyces astaci TaxID=112090 RepID=W4H4W9_APHAT|nr:hypothetical protein H257_02718 [Aphanomyces astaci]ETV86309.1 hypothetical protein H257_02718 [Aphanomyces astaci]|eukprot:XP_009824781.1 hypothetical protein H257_02718 [Aphanomyces astaci]